MILSLRQKLGLGFILVLLLLNFFVWPEVFSLNKKPVLGVTFLDIGQGDAIFIKTPANRTFLIDGGPSSAVLGKLSQRLPFWQTNLDAVVLTHPDQDHIFGLLEVLKKYHVGYIFWTGMVRDGGNYQEWLKLLAQKEKEGTKIVITHAPMHIKNGAVDFMVLNPGENLEGKFFGKQDNDTGIVLKTIYGRTSVLLTADTSFTVEKELLAKKYNLASDILKVGHHGSKYSTGEDFVRAVSPKIAGISVGKDNSYGHPTQEVLQRLQSFGIQTLRTDQVGDIHFESDGKTINYIH